MGGGSSTPTYTNKMVHDRLGTIYMNPNQNEIELLRQMQNENQAKKWVKQLQKYDNKNIAILLPLQHEFSKAGMCGEAGNIKIFYENFPYIMEDELVNRSNLMRTFDETQMWFLLWCLLQAGDKCQSMRRKIGDVNPFNILISQDGLVKVIGQDSIPGQLTNFQKVVTDRNAKVYLAPEELDREALRTGIYPQYLDPCRAEVFSIGLCIIASGILDNCRGSYFEYQRINEQQLRAYLQRFGNAYSEYLTRILRSMVEIRPEARRSCSSILAQLTPYKDSILDLQPFNHQNQIGYNMPNVNNVNYFQNIR